MESQHHFQGNLVADPNVRVQVQESFDAHAVVHVGKRAVEGNIRSSGATMAWLARLTSASTA